MEGLLSANCLSKASIFGGGGGNNIKSLQNGIAILNNSTAAHKDVIISSVDLSKSILVFNYKIAGAYASTTMNTFLAGYFINNQTICFSVNTYPGEPFTIAWTVVEFEKANVQRGTAWLDRTNADVNVTITPVNPNKSILLYSQYAFSSKGHIDEVPLYGKVNEDTITFAQNRDDIYKIAHWQIIEFK